MNSNPSHRPSLAQCKLVFALVTVVVVVIGPSIVSAAATGPSTESDEPVLQAGAYAIDVSPLEFPVIVNGGMRERTADRIVERLHARALVLDDGTNRIAIVVVDSCMMPRELLDRAKDMASKSTGIPTKHILISATHTHSAPAVMGCLGSDRDNRYAEFLPGQIAKAIELANEQLQPARIGWGVDRDPKNLYCRRWIMKEGTAATNRFSGHQNDRAQMNPGVNNPNKIRQTGEVDPDVSVLSVQTLDGKPLALHINYSTHYAGAPALSADYFGILSESIGNELAPEPIDSFVAMVSNGTSGDANCIDFTDESRRFDRFTVAKEVGEAALRAYEKVNYYDWLPIVMDEALLTLNVRLADEEELAEARKVVASIPNGKPTNTEEVYAREAVILSEMPATRELKIQAIRLGDLGIATMPNEVYGSTGLAIKAASPTKSTFNIELANGAEGYIPPADQHPLGGYTTWRARTSCLEVEAETKIRETAIELLQRVVSARSDETPVASSDDEN